MTAERAPRVPVAELVALRDDDLGDLTHDELSAVVAQLAGALLHAYAAEARLSAVSDIVANLADGPHWIEPTLPFDLGDDLPGAFGVELDP